MPGKSNRLRSNTPKAVDVCLDRTLVEVDEGNVYILGGRRGSPDR